MCARHKAVLVRGITVTSVIDGNCKLGGRRQFRSVGRLKVTRQDRDQAPS